MKRITFFMAALVVMTLGFMQAQTSPDYICGSQTPWTWTAGTVGTQISTGVYQWKFTAAATGDVFFKLGETAAVTDGSGFWVNSTGTDMTYTGAGAAWDAYYNVNMGAGGAIKFTATSGYSYVIQSRKASASSNANFAIYESPAAISTISTVAQTFAGGNLTVNLTLSSAPDAIQKFWIKYTNDSWTTVQRAQAIVTGTTATVDIPLTSGGKIEYFAFTTVQAPEGFADYDLCTVSINNNSGKNYKFMESLSGDYFIPNTGIQSGFKLLSEAVSYINAFGISGNTNLLITASMTEAANIGLGVNTNGFNLTVRPDADADRTITFTKTTDNTSPSGHFVIGYTVLTSAWTDANTIATNKVTIDGYANGFTTRRLKFTTASGSLTASRLIMVIGACENTTVKNCIIENKSTAASACCIGTIARKGTAIEVAPLNLTIENNIITAVASPSGQGLMTSSSGTLTTGKTTGLVVKNNIISAQGRGGWFYYINGGEFYGNEIKINQLGSSNTVNYGLWTSTGAIGTFNIYNNKFTEVTTKEATATGSLGVRALSLGGSTPIPTFNVYNNMFAGMDRKNVALASVNQTYVFFGGAGSIYNNTFYMPTLTVPATPGYYTAITLSSANPIIKNNIFISDEDAMVNSFISAVTTGVCDYNLFYNRKGNTKSLIVGSSATYTTLAAYQAANLTKDANSKSKDVDFVSSTDLRITSSSVDDADLGVPRLTTPTLDILGTSRATTTYMGAHEASDLTLPAPTKTFTVTVPNGTSKVYVAGTFTGKKWNIATPYELTATANPNEFTGTFACANDVTYKYLCETGDYDYQAAIAAGGVAESNRTYNAVDPAVAAWLNMKTVTLNVRFATVVPSKLFVKGSWDAFATPIELVKTGSTYSTTLSGLLGNKIPSNTEYKFYTDQEVAVNWESNTDNSLRDNRWSISPVMNDEIARFTTALISGLNNVIVEARIIRTSTGIEVIVDGEANIELYTINGVLIEKTKTSGSYSRDLNSGIYVIRVNGKATKFIK
jgi:hypothetical protein